jgi:hypothetical protein
MPQILSDRILYDEKDWFAGLHPQSGQDRCVLFNGANTMTNLDPLRFLGYISPGYVPTNVTNIASITALIRNGVISPASSVLAYAVGGDLLHEINTTTSAIVDDADFPHQVASYTMSDIIDKIINGTDYVLFSMNGATFGDIGTHQLGTSTFDDDYMSATSEATSGVLNIGERYIIHEFIAGDSFTNVGASSNATGIIFVATGTTPTTWTNSSKIRKVLSKDYQHPFVEGDDGETYVGDGNILYKIADDGTRTKAKINLPANYEIKSFSKDDDNYLLVIYMQKKIRICF